MDDALTLRFVASAEAIDDKRQGLDSLFDLVDDAIGSTDSIFQALEHATPVRSGYESIDAGLARLDPEKLSTRAIMAVLTATHTRSKLLPSRGDFFRKSYWTLSVRRPNEVDQLLRGLGPLPSPLERLANQAE